MNRLKSPIFTLVRRRLLIHVALPCLGIVVGLLVCEILLRIFGYSGDHEQLNTVFGPKYGTVKKTSWIFDFYIDPSRNHQVQIHGKRIPLKKDPNHKRVLFIGDSATAGARVHIDNSFAFQFKKFLDVKKPDNNVEVVNAGVWGMTTIDEYHLLKGMLLPLKPDVVDLGLFMSNDINFNLGHDEKQAALDSDSQLLLYLYQSSSLVHFSVLRAMELNNRYKLLRAEDYLRWKWIPRKLSLIDIYGFHMLDYPAGETATYMKRPSNLILHGFEVLDKVFQKFLALGAEHGFKFRVLIIPTPSTVAGKLMLLHCLPDPYERIRQKGVNVRPDELDFELPTRRVLHILQKRKIPFFDPTQRMKGIGLKVFFPRDEHPSLLGHEALARELVENYQLLVGER